MTDPRPDRIIANVPDGMQPLMLARLVEARLKAEPEAPVGAVSSRATAAGCSAWRRCWGSSCRDMRC